MENPVNPSEQAKPDAKSAVLGIAAICVGGLTLIPSLLLLFILGAVAWRGVRFMWQLFEVFFS